MARLEHIESFVSVSVRGSLTAAAHAEGVAPAVIDCSDRQVLLEWRLQGLGIARRGTSRTQQHVAQGRLQVVLEDFAAPASGFFAVFEQRKHLPLRVRLWIDVLKHSHGQPSDWLPTKMASGANVATLPTGAAADTSGWA